MMHLHHSPTPWCGLAANFHLAVRRDFGILVARQFTNPTERSLSRRRPYSLALTGGPLTLAHSFDNLKTQLRGPIVLPDDADYDSTRAIWNGMIDKKPAAIARCLSTADIIACVNYARDNDVALSMRGGGHNIAGLSLCDDGLMIDMSLMRGVWVDTNAKIAHCQPGCTLGDVDRETQVHGLAAVLGFVSNTGIAGLTLGGGFGYLTKRWGWTSDTVQSMRVVTANGELVTASESENADLFWGLRGGGGNFGIVTGIDYKLYNVGPQIMGGAVAWKADDAPEVLEMFRGVFDDSPPEMTCVAALRKAPPAPWLPADMHGKLVCVLFVCHSGTPEDAERDVAKIKSFGNPIGDVLQPRPYLTQQTLLDATQPNGRRYYWKSEYLPSVEPQMLTTALACAKKIESPHSAILLFPLGGAVQDLPADHSAVGNRDAKIVFNVAGSWDDPAEDDKHIGWARDTWTALKPFSTGGTYINFLTEEEGEDRIKDALGGNYDRLVEIKTKWDPNNLFRTNKNIAPKT